MAEDHAAGTGAAPGPVPALVCLALLAAAAALVVGAYRQPAEALRSTAPWFTPTSPPAADGYLGPDPSLQRLRAADDAAVRQALAGRWVPVLMVQAPVRPADGIWDVARDVQHLRSRYDARLVLGDDYAPLPAHRWAGLAPLAFDDAAAARAWCAAHRPDLPCTPVLLRPRAAP